MRIAILGAGNTGTCTALELASHGLDVDLFDENDTPVSRASFHNEGKVHLGILYAKDSTLRTAKLMIDGALSFAPLLDRWIDFTGARDRIAVSTPFFYGVHVGTMVDVDRLRRHYAACRQLFVDAQAHTGSAYLGVDRSVQFDELTPAQMAALVAPEYFLTMFRTSERAVDPRAVAMLLRAAAFAHPRIHFVGRASVIAVAPRNRGGLAVTFRKDEADYTEIYDRVANTLWHGRLQIDATMGLSPVGSWLYRYKFANRVFVPLTREQLPSITCVLGPFGDIVNYADNGLFVSWYPTGMIATSSALRPPEWEQELSHQRRREVFWLSFGEWRKRCPLLESLTFDESAIDPGGGVIFAWGDTDVHDPHSRLHQRHEIGVHSVGHYHTVNTGKFTLTPFMGMRTAERILGAG